MSEQEILTEYSTPGLRRNSSIEIDERLYLIFHKVRGEPTFDVAHQLLIGSEVGWIIPTSGHRAYPHWGCLLDELYSAPDQGTLAIREMVGTDEVSADLPDHYPLNEPPRTEPLRRRAAHSTPATVSDLENLL